MTDPRVISMAAEAEGATSVPLETTFAALFREHFGYVCASLRRMGVHRDDVEDCAHDVFVVVYRNLPKTDLERPLKPWLFGIAFRVAANQLRRRRRHPIAVAAEEPSTTRTAEDDAILKERQNLLAAALECLPLSRRAVLIMHDIDGLEMTEVARSMGILRFTGYSRLRTARRELATAVKRLQRNG